MRAEMGQGVDEVSFEVFREVNSRATTGSGLLREIDHDASLLRRMDGLQEMRVVSQNDSQWHPVIDTAMLREFVRATLTNRMEAKRKLFNEMFGGGS